MRTRDIVIALLVLLAILGSISVMSGAPVGGRPIAVAVVQADPSVLSSTVDDQFQKVEQAATQ